MGHREREYLQRHLEYRACIITEPHSRIIEMMCAWSFICEENRDCFLAKVDEINGGENISSGLIFLCGFRLIPQPLIRHQVPLHVIPHRFCQRCDLSLEA